MTAKHVTIDVYGLVQGVGFRYMTFTYAQKYGIVGSVANQSDGSVHIEAQGPTEQLMAFMEVIKRGPSQFAHVNHIEVKEQPLDQYSKFSIQ